MHVIAFMSQHGGAGKVATRARHRAVAAYGRRETGDERLVGRDQSSWRTSCGCPHEPRDPHPSPLPGRPAILDLRAIGTTIDLAQLANMPARVGIPSEWRGATAVPQETWADCGASAVYESASPSDSTRLGAAILAALRLRAGRGPLRTLLDQVRVVVQDRVVQVLCRDAGQVTQVYAHLVPLLPAVLTECGIRAGVVVRVQ